MRLNFLEPGARAGEDNPLIIHEIAPGSLELKVIKVGYFPIYQHIVTTTGSPNAVELFLERIKNAL